MNPKRITAIILCLVFGGYTLVRAQDMDSALSKLTEDLAAKVKEHGSKKITVLDFTDLQGGSSELGRYVAEQLTVNMVMKKRDFAVLDRANLKSILAEHKLTTTGLVNPENAKKLGMFAGVDALILGTIVPKNQLIGVTAEIISTDTAEIVGGAKAEFKADDTVQRLVSRPATETNTNANAEASQKEPAKVVKTFGDLKIELPPLQIVNGNQYLLTLILKNQNPKRSIWVALGTDLMSNIKGRITDSGGSEYQCDRTSVSGIELNTYQQYSYPGTGFSQATEIPAGESVSATVKFLPRNRGEAKSGACNLQLEFLMAHSSSVALTADSVHNLVSQINAE